MSEELIKIIERIYFASENYNDRDLRLIISTTKATVEKFKGELKNGKTRNGTKQKAAKQKKKSTHDRKLESGTDVSTEGSDAPTKSSSAE